MPSDRSSLQALKRLISEVDLILATTVPLPENRTARSRELLRAALALSHDLLALSSAAKSPAAILAVRAEALRLKNSGPITFAT